MGLLVLDSTGRTCRPDGFIIVMVMMVRACHVDLLKTKLSGKIPQGVLPCCCCSYPQIFKKYNSPIGTDLSQLKLAANN